MFLHLCILGVVELLFLLLYSTMVNLLEISLLTQLVVGRSGLFSNDSGFIKLVLQYSKLIGKLSIFAINLGDLRQARR